MVSRAAEKDKMAADICRSRCLSELPRLEQKRFEELVVAAALARAAQHIIDKINGYIQDVGDKRQPFCFTLSRPAEILVPVGRLSLRYRLPLDSLKRLVGGSEAVDRWASYKSEYVELEMSHDDEAPRYTSLGALLKPGLDGLFFKSRFYPVDSSGREVAVYALDLLEAAERLENVEYQRRRLRSNEDWEKLPPAARDAIEVFTYAVMAMCRRFGQGFEALAELAARVASVIGAVLPELRRARGARPPEHPELLSAEEVERVREVAREAYEVAVKAIRSRDLRPVVELLNEETRGEDIRVGEALNYFLSWYHIREDITRVWQRLEEVFNRSTGLRAVKEVLVSLSDA